MNPWNRYFLALVWLLAADLGALMWWESSRLAAGVLALVVFPVLLTGVVTGADRAERESENR
jgi:hypothetical protein